MLLIIIRVEKWLEKINNLRQSSIMGASNCLPALFLSLKGSGTFFRSQRFLVASLANAVFVETFTEDHGKHFHRGGGKKNNMAFLCPNHRRQFTELVPEERRDLWLFWMENAYACSEDCQWQDVISSAGSAFDLARLDGSQNDFCMHMQIS